MKRELSLEVYKHFYRHAYHEQGSNPMMSPMEQKRPQRKKRKDHPYEYYKQFRPILLVLRIFGRYSLQVSNKGEYKSKFFSLSMLYCVVVYGLQTYLAVLVCFRRVQALIDSQREYDELIFSIHVLAYLNIHFHVPFTFWIEGGKIASYLTQWANFQDEWTSTFGQPFNLVYKRTVWIYIGVIVPSVLLFLVFEQYATLPDPVLYFLPYFFALVSTALILGMWILTCLELRRLSQELSTMIVQKLDSRPSPWLLTRWRLLWLELRSLTENFGRDLCAVLTSIMLTFSTTFLLGCYNGLVQLITYGFSWKALGYMAASSGSLAIVATVCDGGHRATSGIVSNTLSSLLKGKLSLANPEIKHEVYLLLEAIKADPPEVKLGGFVTLNRPLVVSLISNTLTYLIVLIQFKINEQNEESTK